MGSLYTAIALFGLAAIFGMYLFTLVWRSKTTPKGATLIHGLLAATALVILIVYSVKHTPGPWPSVVIFVIAATGGITLNYRNITGKSIPRWLAVVHGLAAIVGFVLLLIFAYA